MLQKLAVGMLSFAGANAAYFLHVQDQHREKLQADSMEASKTFESVQRASHERSQRWKAAVAAPTHRPTGHRRRVLVQGGSALLAHACKAVGEVLRRVRGEVLRRLRLGRAPRGAPLQIFAVVTVRERFVDCRHKRRAWSESAQQERGPAERAAGAFWGAGARHLSRAGGNGWAWRCAYPLASA